MLHALVLCSLVTGQQQEVRAVSPDQRSIVTSDGTKVDRIDAASQKVIWSYRGPKGKVTTLAFSPDGKMLGIGSDDRNVRLVDVATGKELRLMIAKAGVVKLSFSPDGKTVAAQLANQAQMKWDLATGKVVE
jgi:WD40 repeat protein